MLDLLKSFQAKVIVVSQNYLGSINHTLLTLEVLKSRQIAIEGLIFNGAPNEESERYITTYTGVPILGRIPQLTALDKEHIRKAGEQLIF
ncbi:dithiobiotin synthetase [compost metagenome]